MTSQPSLLSIGYSQSALGPVEAGPTARPWEPFKRIPIRLFGTNKTTKGKEGKAYGRRNITSGGNCIDTVRGCVGGRTNGGRGCFGDCYAKEPMLRYHRVFDIPVSMIFREDLFSKDLERLDVDWVRNGVNGDPSLDWPLALQPVQTCNVYDKICVILTRFWKTPDDFILTQLAKYDTIIHGSISAVDPEPHRQVILESLERFEDLGGRSVPRVVTFAFKEDQYKLRDIQDQLMSLPRAFQQPMRVRGTNPFLPLLDMDQYKGAPANTSGKLSNRWRTAGDLYGSRGCYSHCYDCWNQCMSIPEVWK